MMTTKGERPTCCATKWVPHPHAFGHHTSAPCGAAAKVERDGKAYCFRHDPQRAAAVAREKQAKRDAEWTARAVGMVRYVPDADLIAEVNRRWPGCSLSIGERTP